MQVERGGLQIGVPRQLLDGADVHAVADEVGGEGSEGSALIPW
jgi:hypothetical protein